MRRALMVAVWFLAAGAAPRAHADVTVDPGDKKVVIRGVLDGQHTSFAGGARLTSTTTVDALQLLPSDLVMEGKTTVSINWVDVVVSQPGTLKASVATDVRVTVNNVTRPGSYKGTVRARAGVTELASFDVVLQVGAKPDVVFIPPASTLQLVSDGGFLAEWLFSSGVLLTDRIISLENRTAADIALDRSEVLLRGEKTGATLTAVEVKLADLDSLQARKISSLKMTLDSKAIHPDRYVGVIRVVTNDPQEVLSTATQLDVRAGPWGALLAIAIGIALGRLARSMETKEAQLQVHLYPRLHALRALANGIQDSEAKSYVAGQLEALARKLDRPRQTEEQLAAEIDQLESDAHFLEDLDRLRATLTPMPGSQRLLPQLETARDQLIAGQRSQATATVDAIRAEIKKAAADGTMGPGGEAMTKLTDWASTIVGPKLVEWKPLTGVHGVVVWVLEKAAGFAFPRAQVRARVLKPLLFVLLLLFLMALGLQTLYVSSGSTFGAGGLADYLALMLWGLSADVAQRTLLSLPGIK